MQEEAQEVSAGRGDHLWASELNVQDGLRLGGLTLRSKKPPHGEGRMQRRAVKHRME